MSCRSSGEKALRATPVSTETGRALGVRGLWESCGTAEPSVSAAATASAPSVE